LPDNVFLSDWNVPEFYSAMSFKRRTDQMSEGQRAIAERLFEAYRKNYPNILGVSSDDFH